MKNCKYCKNKIRNSAFYCDQCGKTLDLKIKMEINTDFEKILDYLVSNLVKTKEGFSYTYLIENYVIMFWNYVNRYSNIKDIAKNDKITLNDCEIYLPLNLAYELKRIKKDSRNREFILKLNQKYDEYKNSFKKKDFEFFYFTNIDKRKVENNIGQILELFDLEIVEFEKFEELIKNKYEKELNIEDKFKNEIIIAHRLKGKDLNLQYAQSMNNICGFLGLLTLMKKYNKNTKIISYKYRSKYNLIDYDIITDIVLNNDEFLESIENIIYTLKHINISLSNEKILIHKKFVEKFQKKHIKKELILYLHLYHLASTEKDLSNSFFKYWSLSEKIIKDSVGDVSDNKLIKLMKNILRISGYPKSVFEQIEYVKEKRNKYVHECNLDIMDQSDRNLAKSISEKLLGFLILSEVKIENLSDFGYILEYYNRKDEIKRINILLEEVSLS